MAILSSLVVFGLWWFGTNVSALPTDETSPDIVQFKSKLQSDVGLRFVRNSGVCETTPGVGQISGYADIGTDMSMVCLTLALRNIRFH